MFNEDMQRSNTCNIVDRLSRNMHQTDRNTKTNKSYWSYRSNDWGCIVLVWLSVCQSLNLNLAKTFTVSSYGFHVWLLCVFVYASTYYTKAVRLVIFTRGPKMSSRGQADSTRLSCCVCLEGRVPLWINYK